MAVHMTVKTYLQALSAQGRPNIESTEEFPPLSSELIAAHQKGKISKVATKTLQPASPLEPCEYPSLLEAYKIENL